MKFAGVKPGRRAFAQKAQGEFGHMLARMQP